MWRVRDRAGRGGGAIESRTKMEGGNVREAEEEEEKKEDGGFSICHYGA